MSSLSMYEPMSGVTKQYPRPQPNTTATESQVLYVIAINIRKYAKESSATNKHVLENWIETYDLQKLKEMFLFMWKCFFNIFKRV